MTCIAERLLTTTSEAADSQAENAAGKEQDGDEAGSNGAAHGAANTSEAPASPESDIEVQGVGRTDSVVTGFEAYSAAGNVPEPAVSSAISEEEPILFGFDTASSAVGAVAVINEDTPDER